MKKFFFFLLFLPLISCNNIINNKQSSIDFKCPRLFFSSEDKIFINNSTSIDDVFIKAYLNNFAINDKCQQRNKVVVIPIEILIIAKPLENLEKPELSLPIYISLLDQNNNILETQYFMISKSIKKNKETNKYIETDITDRLDVITEYFETSQIVIGFMLDNKKRKLLN